MNNYNPKKQFRCTIIRGKAKTDLDNLLPKYAKIIQEICPCTKTNFSSLFNNNLKNAIGGIKKTLDNHRTEIAGKLFGMYFVNEEGNVFPSERTLKFLENEDQPEFFKDICLKVQFPNGMDSVHTFERKIENKVSIRQFSFILELLTIADLKKEIIKKNEVAYFVLNSLEVLQGKISPKTVYEKIIEYRNNGIKVKVRENKKASSYSMQHINEQINLLELANLVRIDKAGIILNPYEKKSIDYIKSLWNQTLNFDVYKYSFKSLEERKKMFFDWQKYYSLIDKQGADIFKTSIDAIQFNIKEDRRQKTNKIEIGDDGENFVYNYEKGRVANYDRRLVNKVLLLGKTKGLGYDIQSIVADGTPKSEFVQYIEVKSTKRVTTPKEGQDGWLDAVLLTRNEWIAAEQHGHSFLLYRVYFTPEKTIVYVIKNPYKKYESKKLKCVPTSYRLDFSKEAIDLTFEKI